MIAHQKTGSGGRPWVQLERDTKPPPVDDVERYWSTPPGPVSPRCEWWIRQIARGWRPNKYWRRDGYYARATRLGVYIFESNHVLPAIIEYYDTQRLTVTVVLSINGPL